MNRFSKQILVCSILYSLTTVLFSQIYLEDEAIYNEAEEYLEGEEVEDALHLFLMLESKGHDNANLNYKIGRCYLQILGMKDRAVPYLENATENISANYNSSFSELSAPMEAYLLLGKAYHIQEKFDKAIESFQILQKESVDSSLIQLARFYENKAYNARILNEYPSKSTLTDLTTPSNFSLYNAIGISNGKMLLMEKRKFYDAVIQVNFQGESLFDLQNITPDIGSDGDYVLCGGSANGNTVFLMGYDPKNGDELYYSELDNDGKWCKLKKMPKPINSVFNEASAFLCDDSTLYFSSNRLGGIGGMDIYRSKQLPSGNWSNPENLEKTINTGFNETAPFILSYKDSQYLIFSSEGHLNIGGYDFFYSEKINEESFSLPINMGSPFSTADEDLYLTSMDPYKDFFTTRIFGEENLKSSLVNLRLLEDLGKNKVLVKGQLEFNDTIPAQTTHYSVSDKVDNSTILESESSEIGEYAFMIEEGSYEIEFRYSETTTAKKQFTIVENSIVSEFYLSDIQWIENLIDKEISPEAYKLVRLYIQDILFEFDKILLYKSYHPMLDSISDIMLADAQSKLTIEAYTDNIGSKVYNDNLSIKRAKTIVNYLNSKGISSKQLLIKAMGESDPVAKNKLEDGRDNPEGRKYNRRAVLYLETKDEGVQIIYLNTIPENLKVK